MEYYYTLSYDSERAFRDYDDALQYDMDTSPESHSTSDESLQRAEKVIWENRYDELNSAQKQYLSLASVLDDDGYDVS